MTAFFGNYSFNLHVTQTSYQAYWTGVHVSLGTCLYFSEREKRNCPETVELQYRQNVLVQL